MVIKIYTICQFFFGGSWWMFYRRMGRKVSTWSKPSLSCGSTITFVCVRVHHRYKRKEELDLSDPISLRTLSKWHCRPVCVSHKVNLSIVHNQWSILDSAHKGDWAHGSYTRVCPRTDAFHPRNQSNRSHRSHLNTQEVSNHHKPIWKWNGWKHSHCTRRVSLSLDCSMATPYDSAGWKFAFVYLFVYPFKPALAIKKEPFWPPIKITRSSESTSYVLVLPSNWDIWIQWSFYFLMSLK